MSQQIEDQQPKSQKFTIDDDPLKIFITKIAKLGDQLLRNELSVEMYRSHCEPSQKEFIDACKPSVPNHAMIKRMIDSAVTERLCQWVDFSKFPPPPPSSPLLLPPYQQNPEAVTGVIGLRHSQTTERTYPTIRDYQTQVCRKIEYYMKVFTGWMNQSELYQPYTKLLRLMKEHKAIERILYQMNTKNHYQDVQMTDEEFAKVVKQAKQEIAETVEKTYSSDLSSSLYDVNKDEK